MWVALAHNKPKKQNDFNPIRYKIQIPQLIRKSKTITKQFLCIFLFTEHILAIECYKCSVSPGSRQLNTTTQLCSQFDESDKFIVDCPYSTMCSKKVLRIKLQGKDVDTIVKDCAVQKYTEQVILLQMNSSKF